MGIDYFNCEICNYIFPDVGYYGVCSDCEAYLCESCDEDMAKKYGRVGEDNEKADDYGEEALLKCDCCTGVVIDKDKFIDFLIKELNGTFEEYEQKYRETL